MSMALADSPPPHQFSDRENDRQGSTGRPDASTGPCWRLSAACALCYAPSTMLGTQSSSSATARAARAVAMATFAL
jgi:hypothetical protein